MRRAPAEEIVEFLSFSSDPSGRANEFRKFSPRAWGRALGWLDDAGLAFYFLQKLKDSNATDAVPTWVMSRLERSFAANRQRVADMSHRFGLLNQKLNDAGVRYAVLKGLSLVPQFCPDASLRHQSDFDYLVDDQSLLSAQQVLIEAGYRPSVQHCTQEFTFVIPGAGEPSRTSEQYQARAPHAVELHLDIWHSDQHGLPLMPRLFFVGQTKMHKWHEYTFPVLADEDAFLLQVLHACQHLFTYWLRMSCLFEIGYFLNQRASDTSLWNRIEHRVGENAILREFVVIVTELVSQLFTPPLPPLVRFWDSTIRPGPRVWIESYARHWIFGELPAHEFRVFPRAKLVLFLLQQYREECARKHLVRNRVLPSSRLSRIASSLRDKPSLVFDAVWWKRQLLIRRSLFHALAGLRYLCEIPRWKWLNRMKMRSASLQM